MRAVLPVLFFICSVLPAHAAIWFAGTGNDGYISDVQGIFQALENSPGLTDISVNSFMYADQDGTAIQNSITGLVPLVQPGDLLFWYYSGHGAYTGDDDQDESLAGSSAANAYDETLGLRNQADPIRDDGLALALEGISLSGASIVAMIDACYAGGFIGGTRDLDSVSGLTFLGSSREGELSYAYSNEPYSIFTTGLIRGLENLNADENGDGTLLAGEWFAYSSAYTQDQVSYQHPVFSGDPDRVICSLYPVPVPGSGILLLSAGMVVFGWKLGYKQSSRPRAWANPAISCPSTAPSQVRSARKSPADRYAANRARSVPSTSPSPSKSARHWLAYS